MGLFLWGKGKTDHSDSSQAGEQKRRNDSLRRITFLLRIFEELLIIPAIAMGQPSRMMRPSHLPSLGPLASERAERKGHILKRHSSSQPGTTFARRSPKKAPRPRQARS